MIIVSTADSKSTFRAGRSGHVERFWEVVVFPSSLGPEEALITDFIHHFDFELNYLTVLLVLEYKSK